MGILDDLESFADAAAAEVPDENRRRLGSLTAAFSALALACARRSLPIFLVVERVIGGESVELGVKSPPSSPSSPISEDSEESESESESEAESEPDESE